MTLYHVPSRDEGFHFAKGARGRSSRVSVLQPLFASRGTCTQSFFSTVHASKLSRRSLPYFAKQPVEHILPPLQRARQERPLRQVGSLAHDVVSKAHFFMKQEPSTPTLFPSAANLANSSSAFTETGRKICMGLFDASPPPLRRKMEGASSTAATLLRAFFAHLSHSPVIKISFTRLLFN